MEDSAGSVDLVCLIDPPGTSGHSVSVRVLKGLTAGSELLDCVIVVTTQTVTGSYPIYVTPFDLERWGEALDALAVHRFASWMDSGRSPGLMIKPLEWGGIEVTVHDSATSRVTVKAVLEPASGWVDDQRALLAQVRERLAE
ncbi:hypothetical protein ABH925_007224 [Streptacidiphilus sp. EB129]